MYPDQELKTLKRGSTADPAARSLKFSEILSSGFSFPTHFDASSSSDVEFFLFFVLFVFNVGFGFRFINNRFSYH